MKKNILIFIFLTFFLSQTFAGWGKWIDNIEYGFILWKIWDVKIVTLEKDPYYSLNAWEDKRKYFISDLEEYKYFTHNWNKTNLLNTGVHVSLSKFTLDIINSQFKSWFIYPVKWAIIIAQYRSSEGDFAYNWNNNIFDNSEVQKANKIYIVNDVIEENMINIWIDWFINCDSFFQDIWASVFQSIGVPYKEYNSDEEKEIIQKNIVKDVINKSWFCKNITIENNSEDISNIIPWYTKIFQLIISFFKNIFS